MVAASYIPNRPSLWRRILISFEIIGYHRAAAQLRSMGYHDECQACLDMARDLM